MFPGEFLKQGERISNGKTVLQLEDSGELVILNSDRQVASLNPELSGAVIALMQFDGNFVLYTKDRTAVWSTETHGNPGSKLVLNTDCSFDIVNTNGDSIFSQDPSC